LPTGVQLVGEKVPGLSADHDTASAPPGVIGIPASTSLTVATQVSATLFVPDAGQDTTVAVARGAIGVSGPVPVLPK
jgi:hypothetical protein